MLSILEKHKFRGDSIRKMDQQKSLEKDNE